MWVNDTSGNTNTTIYTANVSDTVTPTWTGIPGAATIEYGTESLFSPILSVTVE